MKVWLGNIAPGTTDEEIKALVKKYAPELTCEHLEHVDGTGSRPGVLLEFTGGAGAVEHLTQRLNGVYWKERMLVATRLGT